MGLRSFAPSFPTEDMGFQLENIVCNELSKRGYDVFAGTLPKGSEIDFVARKPTGEQHYYQVTQSLIDGKVYKRKIAPLLQIPDNFPKTILTLNTYRTEITKEGITIANN